jgi:hypothetical protein
LDTFEKAFVEVLARHPKAEEIIASGKLDEILQNTIVQVIDQSGEQLAAELHRRTPDMLKEHRKFAAEYNERLCAVWGNAFDLYEATLVASLEAGEMFYEKHVDDAVANDDYLFEALVRIHARACRTTWEVLALLRNGFASGAHTRWRTLHELAVVAFFLVSQENAGDEKDDESEDRITRPSAQTLDLAERYLLHQHIINYHASIEYQEHCQALGEDPFDDRALAEMAQARNDLCARFGTAYGNWYGWAAQALTLKNPQFRDIERSAGIEHLRPYYRMASHAVHAGSKGAYVDPGNVEEDMLLAGPSDFGLQVAGQNAMVSLYQICVVLLNSRRGMENLIQLDALRRLSDDACEAFVTGMREMQERRAQWEAENADESDKDEVTE